MANPTYQSSIITHGDHERVKEDIKTLHDIIDRQGITLVLSCVAEQVGMTVAKFKLSQCSVERIRKSYVEYLTEAIMERT